MCPILKTCRGGGGGSYCPPYTDIEQRVISTFKKMRGVLSTYVKMSEVVLFMGCFVCLVHLIHFESNQLP